MRGRIKEDDSSVPAPDGPFAYLRKFREGGQHKLFGRTLAAMGGEARIVLDGDSAGRQSRILQVRRVRRAFGRTTNCRRGAPILKEKLGIFLYLACASWEPRDRIATISG